jgi:hypothetical protein
VRGGTEAAAADRQGRIPQVRRCRPVGDGGSTESVQNFNRSRFLESLGAQRRDVVRVVRRGRVLGDGGKAVLECDAPGFTRVTFPLQFGFADGELSKLVDAKVQTDVAHSVLFRCTKKVRKEILE